MFPKGFVPPRGSVEVFTSVSDAKGRQEKPLTKYVARRHAAADFKRSSEDEYRQIARLSFRGSCVTCISLHPPRNPQ